MSQSYDPNYFGEAANSFASAIASPMSQIIQQKMQAQENLRRRYEKVRDNAMMGGILDNQGVLHPLNAVNGADLLAEEQARYTPEATGMTVGPDGFAVYNADQTQGGTDPRYNNAVRSLQLRDQMGDWYKATPQQRRYTNYAYEGNPMSMFLQYRGPSNTNMKAAQKIGLMENILKAAGGF